MSGSSSSTELQIGQVVQAICGAEDFLPLDGSVVKQTDYPDLYQAMKDGGQLLPPPLKITAATGKITNPVKVVWNGAFYCAINAFGASETSDNGQTWMAATMPVHPFTDMVWSPELGTFCAVASDGVACTSQDGHSWTPHTISIAATAFQAVTWTGTTFVAVGTNNLVALSTDGAAWSCPNPPLNVWNSVVWNGSQFCAVGGSAAYPSATAAWSLDGLAWSSATLPAATAWKFLVWTGSRYIALNAVGTISATSTDGITWMQHPVPNLTWTGLCVSGSNVVASNTSGTFYYTTDGATWTASTAMGTTVPSFAACAISPSGFIVAFFTPGQTFMTSPDGVSWTPRLLPPWANGLTWVLLQHNGQYFLAISNGGVCATSADGINWISHTLPIITANANNYPNSYVAWNGTIGLWLLINSGGTTYYTSPDGATWTSRTLPTGSWPYVVSAGSTFFMQDGSTNNSIYSRNGITWTQAGQRTSPAFTGYYVNGYNYGTAGVAWIAGAPTGGSPYYYAPDVTGNLWTSSTQVPAFQFWQAMCPGTNCLYCVTTVAGAGYQMLVHTGGTLSPQFTATALPIPPGLGSPRCNNLAVNGNYVLIASAAYTVLSNDAGKTYQLLTPISSVFNSNPSWPNVIAGPSGTLAALGGPTAFYAVSTNNGQTWSRATANANFTGYNLLTYSSSLNTYLAVQGIGNGFMTSANLSSWTPGTLPTSAAATWCNVSWTGTEFVLLPADTSGLILRSADGSHWTAWSLPTLGDPVGCSALSATRRVFLFGSTSPSQSLVTSDDNVTMKLRTLPINSNWIDVDCNDNVLVAITNSSSNYVALSSDNGNTWVFQPMASPTSGQLAVQPWKAIAWHSGVELFVVVPGATTTAYAVSKDGVTWSSQTLPAAANAWVDCLANGTAVAIVGNNWGLISYDGVNWTPFSAPPMVTSLAPATAPNQFVIVGPPAGVSLLSDAYDASQSFQLPSVPTAPMWYVKARQGTTSSS